MARGDHKKNSPTPAVAPDPSSSEEHLYPPEKRGFIHVPKDDLMLVLPYPGKNVPAKWNDDERFYRSVIVRQADGVVVSAGFPKFYNWGEDKRDTEIMAEALANGGEVWFTEKVDGSLAIRSVIDGTVSFRTRGTFDGADFGPEMRAVAEAKYPILLDPSFEPECSLMFEFVSPTRKVIIEHPEDDLILLGAVGHESRLQADLPELEELATAHDLRLVETFELPREPEALLAAISAWEGKEGVVARCNGGQTFVKMKAADYMLRHRLRYSLTARLIKKICLERSVTELAGFEAYLEENGGDWEMAIEAKPFVELFVDSTARARERLDALKVEVEAKRQEFPERKQFALEYAVKLGSVEKGAAFALLNGDEDGAFASFQVSEVDPAFAEAVARDDELIEMSRFKTEPLSTQPSEV